MTLWPDCPGAIDHIDADRFSPLGDTSVLMGPAVSFCAPSAPVQAVVIGLDEAGVLPDVNPDLFDLLLTSARDAPRPWVSVPAASFASQAEALAQAVRTWPVAASMGCQLLRMTQGVPFDHAFQIESLTYSTLLAGGEFAQWRAGQAGQRPAQAEGDLIRIARDGDDVTLTLSSPETRNAMTAAMRDALYGALANLLDDPTVPQVTLRAEGPCFSSGGDLGEFGTAGDVAAAHVIRTLHSCARAIHALGDRVTVRFHGAAIGSGLEVPAAAARCIATPDAWFQLPELRMGLIPGAGGTVSVARRIGRHRTAWMFLSGKRVSAGAALAMGLVDAVDRA
jgi:hypothetical protein